MGSCLKQEKNGLLHPASYGLRKLTDYEQKLSTTEQELLAITTGILKYCKHLLGSQFIADDQFIVDVDHSI